MDSLKRCYGNRFTYESFKKSIRAEFYLLDYSNLYQILLQHSRIPKPFSYVLLSKQLTICILQK